MSSKFRGETHWESSNKWYDSIVGKEGHYYHQSVIFPKLLKLLNLSPKSSLLDLGCGQGVLARNIHPEVEYMGMDLSPSLIKAAKREAAPHHRFQVADICQPIQLNKTFSHAAIVLALQNVSAPEAALKNAHQNLSASGTLCIVLNHPCFRIPRQSHWGIDAERKIQYRRIDRYLSPLKIPIQTHPGKGNESPTTFSFHYSLSDYSRFLTENGFVIAAIEEWTSDKKSVGKTAAMENRAREEFPLFLAIKAEKR